MARLAYQETGYTGTNVTHQAATQTVTTESFNKADGALGPNLTWTRQVLFGEFDLQVVSNQMEFFTDSPGFHEDLRIPAPNASHPDVVMTMDVTEMSRTGSASQYLVGVGFVARATVLASGISYSAYTLELSRSTIFGPDLFVLNMNRLVAYPGDPVFILDVDTQPLANVTLPGVLTFTLNGPNLSGTFVHAGIGADLTVTATDDAYPTGNVGIGCANLINDTDTGRFRVDNFSVTESGDVLPADDRGFLWVKNTGGVSRTVTLAVPGATFSQSNPDSAITVPGTSERLVGPLNRDLAVGATQIVPVTYSDPAGLSVAAVRVSTPPPDLP